MDLVAALGDWPTGRGRLHQRLSVAIECAITTGMVPADARLPSERTLARRLSVSRSTVVTAYRGLIAAGLVEARQGSGTYVTRSAGALRARIDVPPTAAPIFHRLLADNAGASAVISFASATVPPSHLLDTAMAAAVDDDLTLLREMPGYLPLGVPALRKAIAADMTALGLATDPAQVIATTGAHQALNLCAAALVRPGDRVVVEDPTYPGAIDAFAGAGARLVPVPVDADGIHVGRLRAAVEQHAPAAISVTPTFHNPTGTLLAEHRRRELADIATSYSVPVIEDHALTYLRLDSETLPPPVAAYAPKSAPFVTIGSASKMFWSGLRTGWIRAPEPWLTRIARRKVAADLGSAVFDQAVTARLIARRAQAQPSLTATLRERLQLCEKQLNARLNGWEWERPTGGPSLWARLPYGDAASFAQLALRHGVELIPGTSFSATENFADYVRIPFTLAPEHLRSAFERLGTAWNAYEPPDRGKRRVP